VIVTVLVVGLFAAGLTSVVRALPYFRDLVFRGVKPWACDLCMSWWGSLAGAVALDLPVEYGWPAAGVVAVAGVAVSLAALHHITRPTQEFVLPPEEP
jgi:hypothetical protein